jgi:hypothetical protein
VSRDTDAGSALPAVRRRTWVLCFLAFFLVTGSWSLATPPYASPDEPSHVFRAAAVVRGQLLVEEKVRGATGDAQQVPRGLVKSAQEVACFAFSPNITADCGTYSPSDPVLVETQSGAARYNPFYYALVGWPSLFSTGDTGLYVMRLVSAALCSLALAGAMTSALRWGRARVLGVGLVVAFTPMAAFLAGVVNPNGFEIALAACVWTSGLALWLNGGRDHGVLLRRIGISGAAMVLTRGLSPLWLAVILGTLVLLLAGPVLRDLLRRRATYVWGAVVVVATAASAAWTLAAGADQIPDTQPDSSFPAAVRVVLEAMPWAQQQYVGTFGWTDTYSPHYSLVVWTVLAGGLVLIAVLTGRRRHVWSLLALLAVTFWLPVLLEASQFNKLGLFWQARYNLPFAMGIVLVACALIARFRVLREMIDGRLVAVVLPLALSVHAACFYWALRRYQVGYSAPLSAFEGAWAPPLGSWTMVAIQVVGLVGVWLTLALNPWAPVPVAEDARGDTGDSIGWVRQPVPGAATAQTLADRASS